MGVTKIDKSNKKTEHKPFSGKGNQQKIERTFVATAPNANMSAGAFKNLSVAPN